MRRIVRGDLGKGSLLRRDDGGFACGDLGKGSLLRRDDGGVISMRGRLAR